jgi:hypothetical protein
LDASLQTHYPAYFEQVKEGLKDVYKELVKNEKYWSDMLFAVTEGDPVKMDRLCRFDVFEFFSFVKNFEKKIKDGRHIPKPVSTQRTVHKGS